MKVGDLEVYLLIWKQVKLNAYKMPNIAFFNDNIRDDIKGSTFGQIGRGYISGVENKEKDILTSIKGAKGLRVIQALTN